MFNLAPHNLTCIHAVICLVGSKVIKQEKAGVGMRRNNREASMGLEAVPE